MALVLEIVIGVMILASFFVAYMSARTWPIYQVVLVAFLFLGTVAFFYLAARTLAVHNGWRTLVTKTQKELVDTEQQLNQLTKGGPPDADGQAAKGIRQLQQELANLAFDRGGVLRDVAVEGNQGGVVQVKLKSAEHGLLPNAVLFAFDQAAADQGGRYVGEFKVTKAAAENPDVELAPNLPLTAEQSQRLAEAAGPWTLYTTMPIDDLKFAVSADERPLRDYELLFHEGYVQRSILTDGITKLNSNIARIEAGIKSTQDEAAFRQTERENLSADLKQFRHERDVLAAYLRTLESTLTNVRESMKATFSRNRQRAAQLASWQLGAIEAMDRQTSQSPSARPSQFVSP